MHVVLSLSSQVNFMNTERGQCQGVPQLDLRPLFHPPLPLCPTPVPREELGQSLMEAQNIKPLT